jgi:hypothetical protein
MKNVTKIFASLLFAVIILTSCGGSGSLENGGSGSLEKNSWSGEEIIAGAGFAFKLETKTDKTYNLTGNAGGMPVNGTGTYEINNETEIELLTGEFAGYKFKKEGASLEMYTVDGDYFMSLN